MQAAGFPIGLDLLKLDRDPIVFNPTRFFKKDVAGLLVKRKEAREAKAAAEALRADLIRRSPLHRAINTVLEQQRAELQEKQKRKPVATGESVILMPPKRPLHTAIARRA